MLVFSLSNRQLAALADGVALQIALPVDPAAVAAGCDLAAWACDRLTGADPAWIRSAKHQSVWTHATNRGGAAGSPAATWGEIVDADKLDRIAALSIAAVIVTVCQVSSPETTRLSRWPGGKFEILKKL